ncbi:hypothetical protein BJ878DRAFT_539893 [Calycina marina]|uniref:Uncharacterized protein n=1 Tax=Calycina marina TaxID=1763456 RepID=A0A9P7Z820_9HELO|nr:hypothetical protein BJ878DRAFT_539893 [Calycina marina]
MRISTRGIQAVASLIFWRTQVEATQRMRQVRAPACFSTLWSNLPTALQLGQVQSGIGYTVESAPAETPTLERPIPLLVLWTSAAPNTAPNAGNTYIVANTAYACEQLNGACSWTPGTTGETSFTVTPLAGNGDEASEGFFFLCFGSPDGIGTSQSCESPSGYFQTQTISGRALQLRQAETPLSVTDVISISQEAPFMMPAPTASTVTPVATLLTSGAAQTSTSTSNSECQSYSTVSGTEMCVIVTPTTTIQKTIPATGSSTSSADVSASSQKKSGLPLGAIIGIAIAGAVALILLILLAFFCCRRRRRTSSPSEQVLLAATLGHRGTSHSLEKEPEQLLTLNLSRGGESELGILPSMLNSHPSLGPYDHVSSSAPYQGTLGPHRKTNSAQLSVTPATPQSSTLQHGASDASALSECTPVSPNTIGAWSLGRRSVDARSLSMYEEPYSDMPGYGECRYVPQVYNHSPTPYLNEPGMTEEDIHRLEEEERRIDAAIAEAERRR